jgi:DNA-binding PadR family transcriptional regulator
MQDMTTPAGGPGAATKRSPLALAVLALLAYKPQHPYGVQRLLKAWGKENVVNIGQRAGLYKTMERLLAAGLIAVRETGRDQLYPERTVYEITDAGREAVEAWVREIVTTPKAEFPEFPAALSFAMLLEPDALLAALTERKATLEQAVAKAEAGLAETIGMGLPAVALLDDEYLLAVTKAELSWVAGVVAALQSRELTWSAEMMQEFANQDTDA